MRHTAKLNEDGEIVDCYGRPLEFLHEAHTHVPRRVRRQYGIRTPLAVMQEYTRVMESLDPENLEEFEDEFSGAE
jgi:hypothetical protein